jgi:hypothetical protein
MKQRVIYTCLISSLTLLGAAEEYPQTDYTQMPFNPPELIRVIEKKDIAPLADIKNTMPHQIAYKWQGERKLLMCVVADPELKNNFPADTAQELLNEFKTPSTNPMLSTADYLSAFMRSARTFAEKKISTQVLTKGIMAPEIAALFIFSNYEGISAFTLKKSLGSFPWKKQLWLHTAKSWNNTFYAQDHIDTLVNRGDVTEVDKLRETFLATTEFDLALEVDGIAIRDSFNRQNRVPQANHIEGPYKGPAKILAKEKHELPCWLL